MSKFSCWSTDYGEGPDEATEIEAVDAEDAAGHYAKISDQQGEYLVANGSDVRVNVRGEGTSFSVWKVSAEMVADYTAVEIEQEE